MFRKAILALPLEDDDYSKYYHIMLGEDLLQSIPLYKKCTGVYFMDRAHYNYTINPSSSTQNVNYIKKKNDFTVRSAVFRFLEKENVFNDEDFSAYRTFCVRLIIDILIGMARCAPNCKAAKRAFEDMCGSDYYKQYICGKNFVRKNVGKKIPLYDMFCHKQYR